MADRSNFDQFPDDGRQDLMELDEESCKILKSKRKKIMGLVPFGLDVLYKKITETPFLRTLYGGKRVSVNHAKEKQMIHWNRMASGNFGPEYQRSVKAIGNIHNQIGLEPDVYISGYAVVLAELVAGLNTPGYFGHRQKNKLIKTVIRTALMDAGISINAYLEVEKQKRSKLVANMSRDFRKNVGFFIENLASLTDETSNSMNRAASSSEHLHSSTDSIGAQVSQALEQASEAGRIARQSSVQIADLDEKVAHISEILELINSIASKTNLLAMNASIEASRAGTAGQGFAVVANEVKALASQSAEAAARIVTEVNQIQEETKRSVSNMKQLQASVSKVEGVSKGMSSVVGEQHDSIRDIAGIVSTAGDSSTKIASQAADLQNIAEKYLASLG